MMQGANSNPVMGVLMGQASTSTNPMVSGLEPQMGRLPDAEKDKPDGSGLFANMLFMLQAGVEHSSSKTSALQELELPVSGSELPLDGQALPVIDDVQSENTQIQTSFLANSNQIPLPTEPNLANNQISPQQQGSQTLNQAALTNPAVIDEARKVAKQLQLDDSFERVDIKTEAQAPLAQSALTQENPSPNPAVKEQALDTLAALKNTDSAITTSTDAVVKAPSNLEEQASISALGSSDMAPASLASQVQAMGSTLDVQKPRDVNRANRADLPLNLRPQAGRDLIQEEMELPVETSESEGLDVEEAFLSKPATTTSNDKAQQPSLAGINQAQAQTQNIQSLNVQAGQLQSNVAVNTEANASLESLVEQAKEKPAPSVHEQINKIISKEETLYLGKQSQFWGRQLGGHITTLIKQDVQEAKIHLDPPELGSLEIKLQVQSQETKVQIHASQPQVREALEQQAFRLREALAQEGMSLSGFDVSSGNKDQAGQEQQNQGSSLNEGALSELDGDAEQSQTQNKAAASSLNLIDTFA